MLDEPEERRPVAVDVDDHDRLVVKPQLLPGDDLDRLVERAEAARQHHEAVGELEHALLARMHAGNDDHLAYPGMPDLAVAQQLRNDADDTAFGGERRIGGQSHEADMAAAIDES